MSPTKPKPRKRTVHRDMPEDPRELARAMFRQADQKIEKEGTAAKMPAAQGR